MPIHTIEQLDRPMLTTHPLHIEHQLKRHRQLIVFTDPVALIVLPAEIFVFALTNRFISLLKNIRAQQERIKIV